MQRIRSALGGIGGKLGGFGTLDGKLGKLGKLGGSGAPPISPPNVPPSIGGRMLHTARDNRYIIGIIAVIAVAIIGVNASRARRMMRAQRNFRGLMFVLKAPSPDRPGMDEREKYLRYRALLSVGSNMHNHDHSITRVILPDLMKAVDDYAAGDTINKNMAWIVHNIARMAPPTGSGWLKFNMLTLAGVFTSQEFETYARVSSTPDSFRQ